MFRKPKIVPSIEDVPPIPPTPTFEATSLPLLPNTEFYPITDKSNINTFSYTKNGKKYNVDGTDEVYLDLSSPYFSLGERRLILLNSENNSITHYRKNNNRLNFTEIFPNYAGVSISDLPLFVKPTNNTKGGTRKHKTTNKTKMNNKKVKNRKSRKTR
jgi:hypothetical protein